MRNKLFILVLILIPLAMIGAGVYYFYGKGLKRTPSEGKVEERLDKSEVKLLVSEKVISPILSFSNERVWYMTTQGRLFRIGLGTQSQPEEYGLPQRIVSPVRVVWPAEGNDFIVEQNIGGHARFLFYDSTKHTLAQYPPALRQPRFLGRGQRIAYTWVTAAGSHELKASDADGRNFEKISDLYRPDYRLEVSLRAAKAAVFVPGKEHELFLVDLGSGEFDPTGIEAKLEEVKFSPDGKNLLAVSDNGLNIYDLNDPSQSKYRNVEISSAVWTEDSSEVVMATSRGFMKYNLATGQEQEIYKWQESENFVIQEIIVAENGTTLIFVDANTGYLYKLGL